MGLFGKIKNALFTEEEETVEIPVIQEERKVETAPVVETKDVIESSSSRFSNYVEEEVHQPVHEEIAVEKEEVKEEKVEEKNSPFQSFDEEEFERLAAINKNRLMERDRKAREEKERIKQERQEQREVQKHESIVRSHAQSSSTKIDNEEETHRFKPTPVISPVYGILDKNYTKEDILPKTSTDGTLPKVMDVDSVRKKAFGRLEEDSENDEIFDSEIEPKKFDDIKITSFEDQVDEDTSVLFTKDEIIKAFEEDEKKDKEKKEIEEEKPKRITREKKIKEEKEEIVEDNDTSLDIDDNISEEVVEDKEDDLEKDLFNLIDSMYQSEEGEK